MKNLKKKSRGLLVLFMLLASNIFCISEKISDDTLIRLASMPEPPVIDGKINPVEWKYASTTFGGISVKSGLMTRRENNFCLGYDQQNIYFSVTSEIPCAPQVLSEEDWVEICLLPPGRKDCICFRYAYSGTGKLPSGVRVASGFSPSIMNMENGNCWQVEMAIPFSCLGVNRLETGEKWGLQMIRHWSSQEETGYWHRPGQTGEMGTFIPDDQAPVVSFDGFGFLNYAATGNYRWTYRVENLRDVPVGVVSGSFRSGVNAAATLDIHHPDLFDKKTKKKIGYSTMIKPGGTAYFQLMLWAQFPGKPRLLYSKITGYNKVVYYHRSMFWDVGISRKSAVYKDEVGLPYLNAGFYPSFGNLLRIAVTFHWKQPCTKVSVNVRNQEGKVVHVFTRSENKRNLKSFEDSVYLPELPLGNYTVDMEAHGCKGQVFRHRRTFSVCSFPWQNLNLGRKRVIIPPFRPLVHLEEKREVHALQTGFKMGDGVWNAVIADKVNILSAPIQFYLDGHPFRVENIRKISVEADRVVYRTVLRHGEVKLCLTMDYDYDGFCKLTVGVRPQSKIRINSFDLRIPIRDEEVSYYISNNGNSPRSRRKPDFSIPGNEGNLELKSIRQQPGKILHYFWLGGVYRGLSWIIDTQRYFSLRKDRYPHVLTRKGNALVFRQEIVNQPVEWEKPFDLVFGFQPTPVKPQAEGYRQLSQYMYDYPPAKGAEYGGGMNATQWLLGYHYPIHTWPNGDDSYFRFILGTRDRVTTREERKKVADEYIARHRNWLRENAPFSNLQNIHSKFTDKRSVGHKRFLVYHNPCFYSCRWPEAEMYKAEWLNWDYPIDDAKNEYIACQTSEYIDKLLYEMRYQIRMGFDGMNFDCFPLGGGYNTIAAQAFREKAAWVPFLTNENMLQMPSPGIMSCTNFFGWRDLMKRTAHLLYDEGKMVYGVPWVDLHTTNVLAVPVAAFCSTVITTECCSMGGEFQDRFPDSYVMADLIGTQAGVIPTPIVSTHGAVKGVSVADEISSMIAFSFAYGLMNHCDQGVTRGFKNYQKARDEVFSFGYGRPENQTLTFYGKKKQPITCSAPDIRTTQVIRPDGKALLMVGNLGEKVRVFFNLSGLNYGRVRITDVFSGNILSTPEVEISRRGYLLLKIERLEKQEIE